MRGRQARREEEEGGREKAEGRVKKMHSEDKRRYCMRVRRSSVEGNGSTNKNCPRGNMT